MTFSISKATNQILQGITTLVTTAVRITITRLLAAAAAAGSAIFAKPGLIEEIEEGGSRAVQVVQEAFFEFEGVVSEAEAESASIWNSFARMRASLQQLFTRLEGKNPLDIEFHHLVEQSSNFAKNAINSMANVVPTPAAVHQEISVFYTRVQPWLNGLSVRQWMATQSWEVQWKAGLEIWKQAMTGAINWRPPGF